VRSCRHLLLCFQGKPGCNSGHALQALRTVHAWSSRGHCTLVEVCTRQYAQTALHSLRPTRHAAAITPVCCRREAPLAHLVELNRSRSTRRRAASRWAGRAVRYRYGISLASLLAFGATLRALPCKCAIPDACVPESQHARSCDGERARRCSGAVFLRVRRCLGGTPPHVCGARIIW
jgi:hypothetical protein